jgi:hypothetical protein
VSTTGDLANTIGTANNAALNNRIYGDPITLPVPTPVNQAVAYVQFSSAQTVSHIAFSRDNSGFFTTDAQGTYLIQAAQSAVGAGSITGWVTVGEISNFGATILPNPSIRHVFEVQNPTTGARSLSGVVAMRVLAPFPNASQLDEIEV